jgi:hypothetical protein
MRCQYCGMLPCICVDPEVEEACPDCGREKNACTCQAHACWKCGRPPAQCVCGTAEEPADGEEAVQ